MIQLDHPRFALAVNCGRQVFAGSQKFCAVDHRRPACQCLKSYLPILIDQLPQTKPNTFQTWNPSLLRSTIWTALATKPQSSSVSMQKQALLTDGVTCNCSVALTSQRKTCLLVHSEDSTNGSEFHSSRWIFWVCSLSGNPCLCAMSGMFANKLGSDRVGNLNPYRRGCFLDACSEDITSLGLQNL